MQGQADKLTMKKLKRDTDLTKVTRFNQHGRMESRVEDNILFNEATGPFNAEIISAIKLIQNDLLQIISTKDKWAQIYVFHYSVLCSPDTIEALTAYLTDLRGKLKKPLATAFVMGMAVEGRAMMAPHYRHVYELAQLNFQLFSTLEEAQTWVQAALDQTD